MNTNKTRITKVRELVKLRHDIRKKINELENKLNSINSTIKKLCPHQNIKIEKEHDFHSYITHYYCPVCKNNIKYSAYQDYCSKNKK